MTQVMKTLRRQLAFQEIVAEMAKTFVNIEDLDMAIDNSLKTLGTFSQASRAYVFEINQGDQTMNNTHEWCGPGVEPALNDLQDLPLAVFPWWMAQLSRGNILTIPLVEALGHEAKSERDILQAQGIVSVLVLPIIFDGTLKGYVGFDHVKEQAPWQAEDTSILAIAADLYSSVFERMDRQSKLKATHDALERSMADLEHAQMKLYQQEKSVALGQLASGMSHEINNPLAFVISNKGMIKAYVEDLYETMMVQAHLYDCQKLRENHEEIMEVFKESEEGLKRVITIVSKMRNFAEADNDTSFEVFNIEAALKTTLDLFTYRIKDKVRVELTVDSACTSIVADHRKMNDVFLNVISNGLDALVGSQKPYLTIDVSNMTDQVKISFKDNGHGISKEVRRQIFNPFFTTKAIGENTGLGLNLVYDIIKHIHKGEIEIISLEGQYTDVILYLPKDQDQ